MPTTPTTVHGTYGISTTVENITIESLSITPSPVSEPVPDQANAVANEIVYDERIDLRMTYRGTKLTETDHNVTIGNVKYRVDSHEEAGTYNGLQRYNLTAHRFTNFPS